MGLIYNRAWIMHLIIMSTRTLLASTDGAIWQHYLREVKQAKEDADEGLAIAKDYNLEHFDKIEQYVANVMISLLFVGIMLDLWCWKMR